MLYTSYHSQDEHRKDHCHNLQTHCPLKVQYHVYLINITMLFLLNTYNSYCCYRVTIIFQLSINNLISLNKS